MNKVPALIFLVLFFVGCSDTNKERLKVSYSDPTKERLKKEYAKNERILAWYERMLPLWEMEEKLGKRTSKSYWDSLDSNVKFLERQKVVIESLEIIAGRDPNAWKKRPE